MAKENDGHRIKRIVLAFKQVNEDIENFGNDVNSLFESTQPPSCRSGHMFCRMTFLTFLHTCNTRTKFVSKRIPDQLLFEALCYDILRTRACLILMAISTFVATVAAKSF